MSSCFAIFGKTPALSAAELFAICKREGMEVKVKRLASAGMIFETSRSDLRRSDLAPDFIICYSNL
jgi:hypothetical protein